MSGSRRQPTCFDLTVYERSLARGLPLRAPATLDEFRRANHLIPQWTPASWVTRPGGLAERSFFELQRAAAGIWAFVLDLEADDRVVRRMLRIPT